MARRTIPARTAPIDPEGTALLLIDVQKGIFFPAAAEDRPWFHRSAAERAVPNMARLLSAARAARAEVVHTVIQSLTRDGRDRSIDYKQTGFHFAPGSVEAEACDEVAPAADEMVLAKSSSSLFNSTVFEYLLRNMGLDTVVVAGFLTDQCVDHTIRDGADRGFRMICAADACTTDSRERHDNALAAFKGYCRVANTAEIVDELGR
ncbi:isochorismatase family cysteine hydrolase [Fodinicurvata sp. EGI_FJ10296]|uniref:cysteine hydrolase family protein n=1 Tax=Fodinicurvata sp. EGI_FJ10296 TaxID=3231908 RepID=UPI003456B35C